MKTSGSRTIALLAIALTLSLTACAKKEISERQRKEAAHAASEGDFAMTVRDWKRAEESFAKAAQLDPAIGAYWVNLGSARVRGGNRSGAKDAYEKALKCFVAESENYKDKPDGWYKQAHMLALLGRVDEGRAVLQQAQKRFPNNAELRAFIEGKKYDQLLQQDEFKQMAVK